MVVFAALGGIGSALLDLTPMEEEEKRAAKAALWASVAAAGAATGIDSTSAAVGGVMAAKEVAGLVVKDEKAMGVIDATAGAATAAVGGNYVELAKVGAGAAVGAAVGGAAGGSDGVVAGIKMGSQLGTGNLQGIACKAVGAGAGAGITAATSEHPSGRALLAGAQMGISAGDGVSNLAASEWTVDQSRALKEDSLGKVMERDVIDTRVGGGVALAGQAAGATVAEVAHDDTRDSAKYPGTSRVERLQKGAELGGGIALSSRGVATAGTKAASGATGSELQDASRLATSSAGLGGAVADAVVEATTAAEVREARSKRQRQLPSQSEVDQVRKNLERAKAWTRMSHELSKFDLQA